LLQGSAERFQAAGPGEGGDVPRGGQNSGKSFLFVNFGYPDTNFQPGHAQFGRKRGQHFGKRLRAIIKKYMWLLKILRIFQKP
jgi:hypothetical protein